MNKQEYVSRKVMDRYNDRWIIKYKRLYDRMHDLERQIDAVRKMWTEKYLEE